MLLSEGLTYSAILIDGWGEVFDAVNIGCYKWRRISENAKSRWLRRISCETSLNISANFCFETLMRLCQGTDRDLNYICLSIKRYYSSKKIFLRTMINKNRRNFLRLNVNENYFPDKKKVKRKDQIMRSHVNSFFFVWKWGKPVSFYIFPRIMKTRKISWIVRWKQAD